MHKTEMLGGRTVFQELKGRNVQEPSVASQPGAPHIGQTVRRSASLCGSSRRTLSLASPFPRIHGIFAQRGCRGTSFYGFALGSPCGSKSALLARNGPRVRCAFFYGSTVLRDDSDDTAFGCPSVVGKYTMCTYR